MWQLHETLSCTCGKNHIIVIADKLTGCKFTIASAGSITPQDTIAVYMETHQNTTITLTTAGTNSPSVAVITYRAHHGEVNSSLDCQLQIDSLEVYRGSQKVTEISHGGFSINMSGSIEVIPWFTSL